MLKAIDTEYKGYLFRSRLEARWAVFFDAMGIEWQYEFEGYVLEDGTKYLPDFYLPKFKKYVEVKPDILSEDELNKARLLAKKNSVILAVGIPSVKSYEMITWYDREYFSFTIEEFQKEEEEGFYITWRIFLFHYRGNEEDFFLAGETENDDKYYSVDDQLLYACNKAKQSRF